MFLDESPLSVELWLRSLGWSSIDSYDDPNSSEEIIVPSFDSESRRGSANFSKVAILLTLIGTNGSLGMPYVLERTGLVLTIVSMLALAVVSDRTLYLFWSSARKTGANTYGGVVRCTFGYRMHCVASAFVFTYLLFMVSQNMRSVHNILRRLLQFYFPGLSAPLILVWVPVGVICGLNLHPLKPLLQLGLCSLVVLLIVLIFFKSSQSPSKHDFKTMPDSWTDSVLGFNMLLLHFVASFNILNVQAELRNPAVSRMEAVVRQGILGACIFAVAIGITGYAFLDKIGRKDGIPINFLDHASLATGFSLLHFVSFCVLYCSSPLLLIPCRDYLLDAIETFVLDGHCPSDMSDCNDEVETWTTRSSTQSGNNNHVKNNRQQAYTNLVSVPDEESTLLPSIEEDTRCDLNMNPFARYGSMAAILVMGELLGRVNTIVPFLWNLLAPSMTLTIAHIVPAACYLEAHKRETKGYKTFCRWVIAVCTLLSLFCTIAAVCDVV